MKCIQRNQLDLASRIALAILVMSLAACGNYQGTSEEDDETTTLGGIGLSQSAQAAAYEATVYPLLRTYCGDGCHDTGALSAPLLFANSSLTTAFAVVNSSGIANLDNPPQSRIVRRPLAENHNNCGSNCVAIGNEILTQVEAWAAMIEASSGGETFAVPAIASSEVDFTDGTEVENDERYETNMIAFWGFKEGSGDVAFDTSGVAPAMDLDVDDSAEWMGAYGLVLDDSRLRADIDDSRKLYNQIAAPGTGTGQYSFEMWINNGNTTQENARIVSYTRSGSDRNFSLHQQEYQFAVRNRSLAVGSEDDGRVELITYDVDQDAQETLQHVVVTYDPFFGRRIYVDGVFTDDDDPLGGERLWNWNPDAQFTVGTNRFGGNEWFGQMRMLAVYKQALTMDQIRQNFMAGVGKRVLLSFDVSEWTGRDTDLQFNVTELDSHSYLFCQPTFVGNDLSGIRVKNIRIVVNPGASVEPPAQGQGFQAVDQILSGEQDQVSRGCSVIAKADGPDDDSFEVEFEELAFFEDPIDRTPLEYAVDPNAIPFPPEAGFRDFARIDATMQEITGVDPRAARTVDPGTTDTIQETYDDLQQQLPSSFDMRSIVSSHQVGLTKLAFEYCVETMDDPVLRQAMLGTEFDAGSPSFFEQDVATAFSNATLADLMSERLADHMLGVQQLIEQPTQADVISELDSLRDDLVTNCQAPCGAEETLGVAKGMCTAILSSAPVMVH